MSDLSPRTRILGISPVQRGIAFALVEGRKVLDCGTRGATRGTEDQSVIALETLIEKYRPSIVALEDWRHPAARRHLHINRLLSRLQLGAGLHHVKVWSIPLRAVLTGFGPKTTKVQMAARLAGRFPEMAPRVPANRRFFENERAVTAVFVALGLAAAYLDDVAKN